MFTLLVLVISIIILSLSCSKDEKSPSEPKVKFGSLEGNVTISNTDTPLEGVNISLDDDKFTNTDSKGHYEFENIEIGEYNLKANRSGFLEFIQTIVLKEGNNNKEIELTKESASFVDGTVTNALNDPISNAIVTIENKTTSTNNQGYYYLENVESGTKSLKIEADFYEALEQNISIPIVGSKTENVKLISSPIPQVNKLEYSLETDHNKITWGEINYPTLKGYNIYKSFASTLGAHENCTFLFSDFNLQNSQVINSNSYSDYEIQKFGYWAKYYVIPVNIDGLLTEYSEETRLIKIDRGTNSDWIHKNTEFPLNTVGPIFIPNDGDIVFFRYRWDYPSGFTSYCNDNSPNWSIQISTDNQNWNTLASNIKTHPSDNETFECELIDIQNYISENIYYRTIGDPLPNTDDCNKFQFNVIVVKNN